MTMPVPNQYFRNSSLAIPRLDEPYGVSVSTVLITLVLEITSLSITSRLARTVVCHFSHRKTLHAPRHDMEALLMPAGSTFTRLFSIAPVSFSYPFSAFLIRPAFREQAPVPTPFPPSFVRGCDPQVAPVELNEPLVVFLCAAKARLHTHSCSAVPVPPHLVSLHTFGPRLPPGETLSPSSCGPVLYYSPPSRREGSFLSSVVCESIPLPLCISNFD